MSCALPGTMRSETPCLKKPPGSCEGVVSLLLTSDTPIFFLPPCTYHEQPAHLLGKMDLWDAPFFRLHRIALAISLSRSSHFIILGAIARIHVNLIHNLFPPHGNGMSAVRLLFLFCHGPQFLPKPETPLSSPPQRVRYPSSHTPGGPHLTFIP